MRTHYILVDYESVQPTALAALEAEHFRVMVFVGANQHKLPFETAAALQKFGPRATYVKIAGNGRNALDFHIAFYIGQISETDPTAIFHIISKDSGFDPLIQHLNDRKVLASRSKDVADIPLLKAVNPKAAHEKLDVVVANLQQRGASRPRTLKTLTSTINSLFQKQLSEEDVDQLLRELQAKGYVTVNTNKVTYELPAGQV